MLTKTNTVSPFVRIPIGLGFALSGFVLLSVGVTLIFFNVKKTTPAT